MKVKKVFWCLILSVALLGSYSMNTTAAEIKSIHVETADTGVSRATGSFKITVPAYGRTKADTPFPLEAGETVTIKATYSPFSAQVDFGLIDEDNNFHYVSVDDGVIDKTIRISERGNYTFAVRNNSGNEISVSGYVNY